MPLRFIAGTMYIVAILVGLFIYSCKREVSQPEEILTVSEAQQWFESQSNKSVTLKSGGDRKFPELKNDWAHAHVSQNDSLGIVDVDVLSKGKFSFVLPDGKRAMDSTGNDKYLNSLSRLVVQKNKRTGNMVCFVMTMVASPAYMEKNNFDLTTNTYLKRQRDFTGTVFYHTVTGEFVNGWRITDGKVVGTCTRLQGGNSEITLKSATKEDCYCVTVTLYNQFCMDWYINGRYSYTNCENRVAEYEDYYLYCSYEPSDGGGSGGGDYEDDPNPASTNNIVGKYFAGHPCGQNALTAISNNCNTGLGKILYDVFGVSPNVNLTFIPKAMASDDGEFNGPASNVNNYVVNINTYVLNNSSKPYIAATLLHEGLHAYFAYTASHDPTFKTKFPCLDTNNSGVLIFVNREDSEHEYMTKYVNEIANVLVELYPTLSQSAAIELSWCGLQYTRAYRLNKAECDKIVPNAFQNGIITTNQSHRTSGCGNY